MLSLKRVYLASLRRLFFNKKKFRYAPSPLGKRIIPLLPSLVVKWRNGVELTPLLDNFLWVKCSAYGRHEPLLESVLATVVGPGTVVVDAGAQVGLVTIMCSKLAGNQGKIYAFEPHPENFKALIDAIARNAATNVEALNMGLSARNGRLNFWEALTSGFSLLPERKEDWPTGALGHDVAVECTALDDFLHARGLSNVDILKVDVDGSDFDVLRGAEQLLASGTVSLVVFECSCYWVPLGYQCETALEFLHRLGFELYVSPISSDSIYKVNPGDTLPMAWGRDLKKALNVYGVKSGSVKGKLASILANARPLSSLGEGN